MKASIVLKQNRDEEQADPTNFWNSSLPMHWSPPRRCLRFQPFRAKFYESQQSFYVMQFHAHSFETTWKSYQGRDSSETTFPQPKKEEEEDFFLQEPPRNNHHNLQCNQTKEFLYL